MCLCVSCLALLAYFPFFAVFCIFSSKGNKETSKKLPIPEEFSCVKWIQSGTIISVCVSVQEDIYLVPDDSSTQLTRN